MRRPAPFSATGRRSRVAPPRRPRTIRASPPNSVAFRCLPACAVLGLFALTLVREGVMDGAARVPPRRGGGGGGQSVGVGGGGGGNDWIPRSDVIRYDQFRNKKVSVRSGEEDEGGDGEFVGGNMIRDKNGENYSGAASSVGMGGGASYRPSLDRYPLTVLRDVADPVNETDVPFLWHIPKAAGSTMKVVLTKCFGLARPERRRYPESLEVIDGYVNVDVSTLPGVARAKDMGLVPSGRVGAVVSSYLHEGAALFTGERRGRLFTVMRHPVRTYASLFHYLGYATWERYHKAEYANMTLEEYAESSLLMDNWMTRYLTREETRELTDRHVALATEILAEKCVVGMIDELDETMRRLQRYFGWDVDEDFPDCLDYYLHRHKANVHEHKKVEEGSRDWNLLAKRNRFDMRVYENALTIFREQGRTLPSRFKKPS